MSRGGGTLYRQAESKYWWAKIYVGGKQKHVRKSTGCTSKTEAKKKLRELAGEYSSGKRSVTMDGTTFEDLSEIIETDYKVNSRKSTRFLKDALKPLKEYFGGSRASTITFDRLNSYVAWRFGQGRKPATAKNELAVLKRAFVLAEKAGKARKPPFPEISVHNARQGFFERKEFDRVLKHLHADLRPILEFAYLSGWRKGEILSLRWSQVDFKEGEIRLEVGETKNSDGRTLVFDALPQLEKVLREQRAHTDAVERLKEAVVPWVFHRQGKLIRDFRGAWNSACKKAEVYGRVPHDFRRTAVRNLERAGVPRSVAMKITGHRTESIYSRYAISNTNDQREGLKKLAALLTADRKHG